MLLDPPWRELRLERGRRRKPERRLRRERKPEARKEIRPQRRGRIRAVPNGLAAADAEPAKTRGLEQPKLVAAELPCGCGLSELVPERNPETGRVRSPLGEVKARGRYGAPRSAPPRPGALT